MKRTIRRFLTGLAAAFVLTLSGPAVSTATACPMCKAANEEEDAKPRAYMYSILFMLSVPATIFSGLTVGLVMIGRREARGLVEAGLIDGPPKSQATSGKQAASQAESAGEESSDQTPDE